MCMVSLEEKGLLILTPHGYTDIYDNTFGFAVVGGDVTGISISNNVLQVLHVNDRFRCCTHKQKSA
jgi:hypothetical protein